MNWNKIQLLIQVKKRLTELTNSSHDNLDLTNEIAVMETLLLDELSEEEK